MPVFEVTSRVTRRSLMNRTKDELASRVLELMDELDREQARREAAEARAKAAEDALLDLTPHGSEFFRRNPDRFAEQEFLVDVPACVAHIRDARERMREGITSANRARAEAVAELRSVRFRHEQATRCAGCGLRKHTPLRVDGMGGYVCLTCIDKRLEELLDQEECRQEAEEPADTFGAHVSEGSLGRIGDREIGPGHVVLSEQRYWWLFQRAGLPEGNLPAVRATRTRDADLPACGSFHG